MHITPSEQSGRKTAPPETVPNGSTGANLAWQGHFAQNYKIFYTVHGLRKSAVSQMISQLHSQKAYILYTLCIVRTCNMFWLIGNYRLMTAPAPRLCATMILAWDVYLALQDLPESRSASVHLARSHSCNISLSCISTVNQASWHWHRWLWTSSLWCCWCVGWPVMWPGPCSNTATELSGSEISLLISYFQDFG